MKRMFGGQQMGVDQIAYYPLAVPPIYSDKVVYSVMKVLLSGFGQSRLETFWRKAMQGVVAWRVSKIIAQNPLFVGDILPYYTLETNLPFPSPNEGRLNGDVRQVAATLMRPSVGATTYTVETFAPDATTWFRNKNFIEIDNLMCQLNGPNGEPITIGPGSFWGVELEFLFIVTQWE